MKERPILFSSDMVRAILGDRKTQTRRAVKPQPIYEDDEQYSGGGKLIFKKGKLAIKPISVDAGYFCPYGVVGDRLWVRENWWAVEVNQIGVQYCVFDNEFITDEYGGRMSNPPESRLLKRQNWRWGHHPNIHLPKAHARIWLEITNVRVERVQEISEEEALKEGMLSEGTDLGNGENADNPYEQFAQLWDSLNAKRGYGWDENPWVWVIEFKKLITAKPPV